NVFDDHRGKPGHQRKTIANKRGLRRLRHNEAGERQNISDGVTHEPRPQRIPESQSVWRFYSKHPRNRSHNVTDRRNQEDENEAGPQTFNAINDLANTGLLDEVGKKHDAAKGKNNSKRRKS